MLRKIIRSFTEPKLTKTLLSFRYKGYLKDIGWFNAFEKQEPVDSNNKPIPWVTYPFIDFISGRLDFSMQLFEFGSGNSTLYYAGKVSSVTAVEHDKDWYDRLVKKFPYNINILYCELQNNGNYCRAAMGTGKLYHVIIVDGRDRVNCILNSVAALTTDGIMVLDDSERMEYQQGIEHLLKSGFRKLDFWGISPGLFYKKCTTVFYRNHNCFHI